MEKSQIKKRIQGLLNRLDELEARDPVRSVERLLKEEESLSREKLRETPTGNALKMLARGVEKIQRDNNPPDFIAEIEKTRESTKTDLTSLQEAFKGEIEGVMEQVRAIEENGKKLSKQESEIFLLRLAEHEGTVSSSFKGSDERTNSVAAEVGYLSEEIPKIYQKFGEIPDPTHLIKEVAETVSFVATGVEGARTSILSLEKALSNRINGIQNHGGGNANRNIAINGNTSVLSRYTDINLKAGSNVTLTYATNQTTKYTDITISATGGGGSFSVQVPTGTVNGVNRSFTFATEPQIIALDNMNVMNKVSSDGTVNWTGTTSVTLTQAPSFNIFGY